MDIHNLLSNPPKLHTDSLGKPTSWQLEDEVLSFIHHNIDSKSKTLETGAGISTILFAIVQSEHTCIVPDIQQIHKIKEFCQRNNIPINRLNFIKGTSEQVLPKMNKTGFDLVLIDGRHAFPTPFIDWYYTAPKTNIGGLVIIDDTPLWTGNALKNFLMLEPEWSLIANFSKTVVFKKEKEGSHEKEWVHQPFMLQNSAVGIRKEQLRYAINLIRAGKISLFITQILMKMNIMKKK